MNIDDKVKHFRCGQPTKYNEEKHIKLLMDIFDKSEGIMAFCSEALISKRIFFDWLEAHPKFKEAYEHALCTGGRRWETYPQANPEVNMVYWSAIMRNRYGYGKVRVKRPKDTTPKGRIDAIWEGAEQGEYSMDEITKLSNLAQVQANIETGSVVTNQSSVPLTTEELEREISLLKELKGLLPEEEQKEKADE